MPTTSLSYPTHVDFGPGALARLPEHIRRLGTKAFVVTDPGVAALPIFAQLAATLDDAGVPWSHTTAVSPNPLASECEAGGLALRASGADVVVGLGGGSALDAAKGIALMATHPAPIVQYDDALGGDRLITNDVAPVICIPTTAGTGSEVGRSTVVIDEATHRKIVVFAPSLMPALALVDPALMTGMPRWLTAATGFDALTHNLEALVAKGYHPLADGIALEGIALVHRYLDTACATPDDIPAREGMAFAALMGATAFQKGLGAAHSLAHPLGALAGMHHGLANAIVLPWVVAFNRHVVDAAYTVVERRLDLRDPLEHWLIDLRSQLDIPHTLAEAGLDAGQLDELADHAFDDACHASNPRSCTRDQLRALLQAAYDGASLRDGFDV